MGTHLTAEENLALQELRKDESIVILPADKGNSTVVLDRQDYDRKASALLDGNAYTKLKKNPTNQTQTQMNKLLAAIVKNHPE